MQVSAELRWFWRGAVPREIESWFRSDLPPGGGRPREDVYLVDPAQAELGIKQRGHGQTLEVKGLVGTLAPIVSGPFAGRVELWCKWPSGALSLASLPQVATAKTRWLRKFAAGESGVREVELDEAEEPKYGEPRPAIGCNVELTRVVVRGTEWWTLGFEAFGPLHTVEKTLRRTADRLAEGAPQLRGGTPASYPEWLSRMAR
jgi:hypothetical protein